jgi:hypothetical protein
MPLFLFLSNQTTLELIMFYFRYKTRVERIFGLWQVQRRVCGQWETMPFVYSTRREARNDQHYWS